MPTKLHAAARDLAAKGIPVFPIRPGTKYPAFKRSFYDATTDLKQINAWWERADYNIGMCPDDVGWCVVDVDTKAGAEGEQTLAELEKIHGQLSDTLITRTPSGGRHLYFQGSLRASQGKSGLGPGLDTRGYGSYVLAPPSIVAGVEYTVEHNVSPAPLPEWIRAALGRRDSAPRQAAPDSRIDSEAAVSQAREVLKRNPIPGPDGPGDDYVVFCRCKDLGVSEEKLLELCLERGAHETDTEWLEVTIGNARRYGQNEPASDYHDPAERLGKAWVNPHTYKAILSYDPGPVRELIPGLLERNRVAYLVGSGGMHKSRIGTHWGLAVHVGAKVYDLEVERAHFVHLSWENGKDEDARRAQAIARRLGLDHLELGTAYYRDLCDDPRPLATVDRAGGIQTTNLWDEIAAALGAIPGHKFVLFDSLYNALHFQDQAKVDESAVRETINWLDGQARLLDFTGLMLQHPSTAARNQGEGKAGYSEAWNNAPRVRLAIDQPKDSDNFVLTVAKRNNAVAGGTVTLKWDDGILSMISSATGADRFARLDHIIVEMATLFADQQHPIAAQKIPSYAMNKLERELGWRPTKDNVIAACERAVGEKHLVYHRNSSNKKYPTGYYAAPGPGGKGFD